MLRRDGWMVDSTAALLQGAPLPRETPWPAKVPGNWPSPVVAWPATAPGPGKLVRCVCVSARGRVAVVGAACCVELCRPLQGVRSFECRIALCTFRAWAARGRVRAIISAQACDMWETGGGAAGEL